MARGLGGSSEIWREHDWKIDDKVDVKTPPPTQPLGFLMPLNQQARKEDWISHSNWNLHQLSGSQTLNYASGFPGFSAFRQQITEPLSLHSCVNQFLFINLILYIYISPTGSVCLENSNTAQP